MTTDHFGGRGALAGRQAPSLLQPHPALKAISEQASPADQWMNDDDHRYGALRESYAFEYAVYEQADKHANTHFAFETYDTYSWYLNLGPLSNINAKYLFGRIPYWNAIVEHPDYDAFWKDEAWVNQLKGASVPNLNVAGFWDQEDPWGPWEIYRRSEMNDPGRVNVIAAGPWFHGQWHQAKAESIGLIPFGGHDTAAEFREKIEAPWFRYWLHGSRQKFSWKASTFQTGSNTWHTYPAWPPASTPMKIYLHEDGTSRSSHPRPPTDSFSTSRIPRIPCRIGSGRFRRRIPKGTGAGGKLPISGSWRIGLTSPRGRAARSIATSPSPAR
jgi:uncharacterized protein